MSIRREVDRETHARVETNRISLREGISIAPLDPFKLDTDDGTAELTSTPTLVNWIEILALKTLAKAIFINTYLK